MQSKQGVKLCCGCNRDYSKPIQAKTEENKTNNAGKANESEINKLESSQVQKQSSHKKVEFKPEQNQKVNMYEHLNDINIDDNEEFKIDDDLKQNARKNSYKKHCEEKHGLTSSNLTKKNSSASQNSAEAISPQKSSVQTTKATESMNPIQEQPSKLQPGSLSTAKEGSQDQSKEASYQSTVASSVNRKIEWLCRRLEQETDLDMINRTLDVISKAQNVLKSL